MFNSKELVELKDYFITKELYEGDENQDIILEEMKSETINRYLELTEDKKETYDKIIIQSIRKKDPYFKLEGEEKIKLDEANKELYKKICLKKKPNQIK